MIAQTMDSHPDSGNHSVRRPLLLPLFGSFLVLLLTFILSAQWLGQKIKIEIIQRDIKTISEQMDYELREQSAYFASQMVTIASSDSIRAHFLAEERELLLQETLPILKALQTNHVTHLYFHRADKSNFLRVHQPDRFNDTLQRTLLDRAAQSGRFTFGNEVGGNGTLNLRAIMPWHHGDRLIGYLEIGKEIVHFVANLQQSFRLPLYTFIERPHYNAQQWHNISQLFGVVTDTTSFPDLVFIGLHNTPYPPGLSEYLASGNWRHAEPLQTLFEKDNKNSYYFSLPIRDLHDKIVYRVVGSIDISRYGAILTTHMQIVILAIIFLILLLGLLFNRLLLGVEKNVQQSAQATRTSDGILRNTLEAFEQGILVVDGNGKITHTNSRFCSLWNITPETLLHKQASRIIPALSKQVNNTQHALKNLLASARGPSNKRTIIQLQDGRQLEQKNFPLSCREKPCGQLWLFHDITREQAMERQELNALQSRIAISALLETAVEPLSLERQLNVAIDIILTVPWLSILYKGSIFLLDEEGKHLNLVAQRGLHPHLLQHCAQLPLGYCLCGRAALTRKLLYQPHITADHDVRFPEMSPHGHYCVPILSREILLGVLNLYVPDNHQYSPEEEAFLTTISYTLASLIELRSTKMTLQEKEMFAATLLNTAPALVVVTDPAGRITLFNLACQQLTGHSEEAVLGQELLPLLVPSENHEEMKRIWQQLREQQLPNQHESYWITQAGEPRLISWSNNVIRHADGSLRGIIATGMDITARKQAEERLQHLAGHDPLTGVYNRRLLHETLSTALAYTKRDEGKLAVLYLDLDHFKPVNDRLGHAAGDQLLLEVVERLQASIRQSDTLARMGGDEFAIILTNVTAPVVVEHVANKILAELSEPFIIHGEICRIGASIGIALLPEHGQDADTLLKLADQAMYNAKEQGRNQFRFAHAAH
ncbi:diguanylate cyclase domain-containing protein [Candidatus Magnetaquicoccus inordinatus]|uniref:diguanylate cyclase domain-containing protein n=1 Tax=Candidatus Magnetaquicoccus inordinatus TaxID=2496818 RepID=UPI00102CEC95|nr:diguanylate cyclase [Candidatus Magnetaquicoccus inordinatus]